MRLCDEFIIKEKVRPIKSIIEQKQLASWISNQLISYNSNTGIMKNEHIKNKFKMFLEKYNSILKTPEDIWKEHLNEVSEHISKYLSAPSDHSKIEEHRFLGKWIQHQKTNFKTKTGVVTADEICDLWTDFCNKFGKYFTVNDNKWNTNLNECMKYIDEYNVKPSRYSKIEYVVTLANWFQRQKDNFKTKKKGFKDIARQQQWVDFVLKYPNIFTADDAEELSNDESDDESTISEKPKKVIKPKAKIVDKSNQQNEKPKKVSKKK